MSESFKKNLFILFFAITITIVYWPLKDHEFINFDDDLYVTENEIVKRGLTIEGIQWAFGFNDKGYWQPLTWLSHMTDCMLFGLDPAWHHLHNLMIHLANCLLLFLGLYRISGQFYRSAFVISLFAVHPLNIDSVAWVAERKNLLSTFFWMVSLIFYARYVARPNFARYSLTFIAFVAGLMVKPMLVTLPFVFLLLDFWPLRRTPLLPPEERKFESSQEKNTALRSKAIYGLFIEKIPFFVISFGSVCMSIISTQNINNMVAEDKVSIALRIGNALISYVSYAAKMIWPFKLAVYYPFPETLPFWPVFGAGLLLVTVAVLSFYWYKNRAYLAIGWLWYLGTLVPVIGIVQGGLWPAMADRWAYVPLIGLFITISWGMADIAAKWRYGKPVLITLAVAIIVIFSVVARTQLQHWRNSTTLFEHALAVTKNNYVSQNNLGNALAKEGRLSEAVYHYKESIRLKPDYSKAFNNLGIVLAKQGNIEDAIRNYSEALRLNSSYAEAYNNLGAILTEQGQVEEGIQNYFRALELKPDYAEAHNNLGVALKKQGQMPAAAEHYLKALRLNPNYAEPHYNLGIAFFQFGKVGKAIYHFRKALQINPTHKNAQENLEIANKFHDRIKAGN